MSTQSSPKKFCKRCGKIMILRNGSRGKFYGCSGFPKCRSTEDYADPSIVVDPNALKIAFFAFNKSIVAELRAKVKKGLNYSNFKPSAYQQAIADFVLKGKGNAFVGAVAGSGKSTTALWQLALLAGVPSISTLHSHGFQIILKAFPQEPIVDEWKKDGIAQELLPDVEGKQVQTGYIGNSTIPNTQKSDGVDNKYARSILVKLASLVQNTLTDENDRDAIEFLIERYGIETNGCEEQVLSLLPEMIKLCQERVSVIDYDDMIWMPVKLNLPFIKYDWIFVDEEQDMNLCQLELVARTLTKNGRIVGVGDPYQSIYGFRGADAEAVQKFIDRFNAIELPLSITYRCPKSHVELAKQLVPHLQAAENATDGEILYSYPQYKATAEMLSGDLVLCRLNAPLVKIAYSLIRSGKKAIIRGRDIGKGLMVLVDKMKAANIPELVQKLEEYRRRELEKLYAKKAREASITSLNDRVDTLIELTDGIYDLSQLRARIETIFSDKDEGIICSSVHRAKGLEAENVYVIEPGLMPFSKATRDWEIIQERNILYVAITRSKKRLVFVDGYPTLAVNEVEQEIQQLLAEVE